MIEEKSFFYLTAVLAVLAVAAFVVALMGATAAGSSLSASQGEAVVHEGNVNVQTLTVLPEEHSNTTEMFLNVLE